MKQVVVHMQTKYADSSAYRDDFYLFPSEDHAIDWIVELASGKSYASTHDFFSDPKPEQYGLVWRETDVEDQKACWYMKRAVGILWKARIQRILPPPIINDDHAYRYSILV